MEGEAAEEEDARFQSLRLWGAASGHSDVPCLTVSHGTGSESLRSPIPSRWTDALLILILLLLLLSSTPSYGLTVKLFLPSLLSYRLVVGCMTVYMTNQF